jgi:competence protein ComEC
VALAIGIGTWFSAGREPGVASYALAGVAAAAGGLVWIGRHDRARVPAAALMLVALGFLLAGYRGHSVGAPVLTFRYYGPIEGRVVAIDRSFSDQLRVTLDRVVLERTAPDRTPERVRVALHGEQGGFRPEPGMIVMLTGHLSPPEGPVEPGGFDFQRLAWFSRLGGVGYTRSPVLLLDAGDPRDPGLFTFRLRMAISAHIQAQVPGQPGALAAALLTGDRSAVLATTNGALRGSNLSHLLSISGMHMALLVGFAFAAMRYGLALIPPLALRLPVKKIAAVAALFAASFYMALAGDNVATRRAYVMAVVMLLAVLLDRRAISLRSVALAAMIILTIEPESLTEPGFQMSFGATVALVAVFGPMARHVNRLPWVLRPLVALVLSSAVAGTATAPIAAAHFNRIAEYGLLANTLAVPMMGTLIMPAGVVAAVLAPLGLDWIALKVLEVGCQWVLAVAHWVAGLDGAIIAVPSPPGYVLPVMALGGLLAMMARHWLRAGGAAMIAVALAGWVTVERPDILVSGDGALLGVLTDEGRVLSKAKGSGFIAQSWLEDDGDGADQETAFGRAGLQVDKGQIGVVSGGWSFVLIKGKDAAARAVGACADRHLLILAVDWEGPSTPPASCVVFDRRRLRETGALAINLADYGPRIVTSAEVAGDRLWNRRWYSQRKPAAMAEKVSVSASAD